MEAESEDRSHVNLNQVPLNIIHTITKNWLTHLITPKSAFHCSLMSVLKHKPSLMWPRWKLKLTRKTIPENSGNSIQMVTFSNRSFVICNRNLNLSNFLRIKTLFTLGPVYMKEAGPLNGADFHIWFIWKTGWFSARLLLIPLCK